MFPYIALVSWAAIAQGVLNTYRVFWVSAMTSVLLNIAIIGCALGFAAHLEQPVYGFAIGVLLGGALQLAFQLPFVYRLGYRWRPKLIPGPAVRKALWLLVPTLFGAGVYQINVLVSQAIAWSLGGGAVSSLQYSGRLLELTLGVFAVAVSTVVLPSLAADAAAGSLERVRETVLYSVRLCAFVCFPVTVGLFLLRTETASLLFERGAYSAESTQSTAYALGFHIIGLTHIALARVFVPVFYAFKDTKTPVYVAALSMVVNVALCYALAGPLGHGGIALANTASAFVQAFALAALLSRTHGSPQRLGHSALGWDLAGSDSRNGRNCLARSGHAEYPGARGLRRARPSLRRASSRRIHWLLRPVCPAETPRASGVRSTSNPSSGAVLTDTPPNVPALAVERRLRA